MIMKKILKLSNKPLIEEIKKIPKIFMITITIKQLKNNNNNNSNRKKIGLFFTLYKKKEKKIIINLYFENVK